MFIEVIAAGEKTLVNINHIVKVFVDIDEGYVTVDLSHGMYKQLVVKETYDEVKQKIAKALNPVEITCNNDYRFPMNTQEM